MPFELVFEYELFTDWARCPYLAIGFLVVRRDPLAYLRGFVSFEVLR